MIEEIAIALIRDWKIYGTILLEALLLIPYFSAGGGK